MNRFYLALGLIIMIVYGTTLALYNTGLANHSGWDRLWAIAFIIYGAWVFSDEIKKLQK